LNGVANYRNIPFLRTGFESMGFSWTKSSL